MVLAICSRGCFKVAPLLFRPHQSMTNFFFLSLCLHSSVSLFLSVSVSCSSVSLFLCVSVPLCLCSSVSLFLCSHVCLCSSFGLLPLAVKRVSDSYCARHELAERTLAETLAMQARNQEASKLQFTFINFKFFKCYVRASFVT